MAADRTAPQASVRVRLFDGARRPLAVGSRAYLRVFDGSQRKLVERFFGGDIDVRRIPVRDNLDDNLRVVVSAGGYGQAGFHPVKVMAGQAQNLDLMLLSDKGRLDFSASSWDSFQSGRPALFTLLSAGAAPEQARERYERLMKEKPRALAALLNIATALEQVRLKRGDALSYYDSLIWDDSMGKSHFFAYVDGTLLDDVRLAVGEGRFGKVHLPGLLHPHSIDSYRQKEFGNGNVQLTFYLKETITLKSRLCMKVEADMDYYPDPLAHFILEVVPHEVSGSSTDPERAYQLRWIAGRRAGAQEFDPGYTID